MHASGHPDHVLSALLALPDVTIGGTPGLTAQAVAEHLGASVGTVRRSLLILAHGGLVEIRERPGDRRANLYRLDPQERNLRAGLRTLRA